MLDIKFVRENPEVVKQNIRNNTGIGISLERIIR